MSPAANFERWWKNRTFAVTAPSHANFAVAPIGDEMMECNPAAAPVRTNTRPVRINSHVVLAQNCATRSRAPGSGI